MKKTRAIELLSQKLCQSENVKSWLAEQDQEDGWDLRYQAEWCEALRMAIRALGGATV